MDPRRRRSLTRGGPRGAALWSFSRPGGGGGGPALSPRSDEAQSAVPRAEPATGCGRVASDDEARPEKGYTTGPSRVHPAAGRTEKTETRIGVAHRIQTLVGKRRYRYFESADRGQRESAAVAARSEGA